MAIILSSASVFLTGCNQLKPGEIYNYGGVHLKEKSLNPKPNLATMKWYLDRRLDFYEQKNFYRNRTRIIETEGSNQPRKLEFQLSEDKYVLNELNETGLISYLKYENGKVTTDHLTPENRFGDRIKNDTRLESNSVGKSVVSYLIGHAICQGHIDSIDQNIDDWHDYSGNPLFDNTLYSGQTIRNLLNMRAGDQSYVRINDGPLWKAGHPADLSMMGIAVNLQNTKPDSLKYNYNSLPPHILINYLRNKLGAEADQFFNYVFDDYIGVENSVAIISVSSTDLGNTVFASRHDYLRLAITILEDWKNDTCVGSYLKKIYKQRQPKRTKYNLNSWTPFNQFTGYGGFFHTDYYSMRGRNILGMDGLNGQMIWIDLDNERIVVTNAIYRDFDWRKIVRDVIKD